MVSFRCDTDSSNGEGFATAYASTIFDFFPDQSDAINTSADYDDEIDHNDQHNDVPDDRHNTSADNNACYLQRRLLPLVLLLHRLLLLLLDLYTFFQPSIQQVVYFFSYLCFECSGDINMYASTGRALLLHPLLLFVHH
mmetsp:Transcript_11779/g.12832  ORF Transcript_11779/g.12832 Transcript_11779/m.12832 type:complete len:139 (-) Transcript_11779:246-662(-)